jgi:cell wall-associated NlpC family hydrolase
MSLPRLRWRARRAVLAVVVLSGLLAPGVDLARPAAADPAPAVADAVGGFREARDHLREARIQLDEAQAARDERAGERVRAVAAAEAARDRLDAERHRYAAISTEYFVRHGADDDVANDSMHLALSGLRERLDAARDDHEAAEEARDEAEERADAAEEDLADAAARHVEADGAAGAAAGRADQAIADAGAPDLPAVAYVAYVDATRAANEAHPGCALPAAVVAGLGRITSEHGRSGGSGPDAEGQVQPALRGLWGERTADTDGGALDGDAGGDRAMGPLQLTPALWVSAGKDADGDGTADPDGLVDAAAAAADLLCEGPALESYDAMESAVESVLGQQQQAMVVLGTARRYAQSADLDLGRVPPNPRGLGVDANPQFDISDTNLAPGDVLGMIDWAFTRLGTPYSQCLGPLARPQDPVCPPGTNRFGAGFFDCSGFVSSAYRRIGLSIPATTYAMEASSWFMSSRVASRFDTRVMQPGDVFLMNGHTGMYVGGGMIIHAVSRGLTYEPVPRWVANGTFAVLRPIDLVGRPAPPPGSEPIAPPDVLEDLRGVVPIPTPAPEPPPDLSFLLQPPTEPPAEPPTTTTTTTRPPTTTPPTTPPPTTAPSIPAG